MSNPHAPQELRLDLMSPAARQAFYRVMLLGILMQHGRLFISAETIEKLERFADANVPPLIFTKDEAGNAYLEIKQEAGSSANQT